MALSINLAEKYSKQIDEKFTAESFVGNDYSNKYSWDGIKTLHVYTPQTVDLVNYKRPTKDLNAAYINGDGSLKTPYGSPFGRFGDYTEVQDDIEPYTLSVDRSFALTMDSANREERQNVITAMSILGQQIKEKVTPEMDMYTFSKWAFDGTDETDLKNLVLGKTIAANKWLEEIFTATAHMDNKLVPQNNRTMYVPMTKVKNLVLDSNILHLEGLGTRAIEKGTIGTIAGMKVKAVPDSLLPYYAASDAESKLNFMIVYKDAVLRPVKIKKTRILSDVAGIDGSVIEARYYYDAFVLKNKKQGIYVSTEADEKDSVLSFA